ncbi:MAG: alpha/beta fold hydrolase [Eubacterium sp.]|nr:alpha/beta fold hydrolase [Eubacterium sp.]
MKKRIVKVISIILALVMAFSISSVAFAKETKTPVILIHGLGGNDLYKNINSGSPELIPAYGLDVQSLLTDSGVMGEAVKLLTNEVECNYTTLFTELGEYFEEKELNCDSNGNAPAGQGVINYWTTPLSKHKDYYVDQTNAERGIARQLVKTYGAKNVYVFNYDWRLDVRYTATLLRKQIVAIKKRTGSKKVNLIGCSLGGAVMSAYLDAYKKKNDVARYVFVNPAIAGVDVARLLELDIKIDKKKVLSYLKHMETAYDGGNSATLFKAISALGDYRIGIAVDNLNVVAKDKKLLRQLFMLTLKNWIGNIPAYWECIPYSRFGTCVKKMSDIGFLNKKSGLYKKILAYHKVQGRFNKNIKYAKKKGAQVAIIANYGTRGIPVTSKASNQTDILIDTKYASGGATCAKYGKKLKRKGKYVSPDKVIDASTCVLPDNTWFIKGLLHIQFHYGTDSTKFICNLACGKVKMNLKSVKKKYKYKQFMKADSNQGLSNIKK